MTYLSAAIAYYQHNFINIMVFISIISTVQHSTFNNFGIIQTELKEHKPTIHHIILLKSKILILFTFTFLCKYYLISTGFFRNVSKHKFLMAKYSLRIRYRFSSIRKRFFLLLIKTKVQYKMLKDHI